MRCKYFSAIGISTSLLLMALPCGVTLRFQDPLRIRQYSYLSPTPMLCGNWFPILAILFSVLALVFLLLRRDYGQMAPVCLGLSIISQCLSWVMFSAFSVTGLAVVLIHSSILLQKHLPSWSLEN